MKKTILILSLAITTLIANAHVITVSNNPNSPGQYTDFQTAITAANAGDTIYVSGSITDYGPITINKRLALFGTGANPQKQFPFVSSIQQITLDSNISISGASGSIIEGFKISNSIIGSSGNYIIKNIQISRNNFSAINVLGPNWNIENNIINGARQTMALNFQNI